MVSQNGYQLDHETGSCQCLRLKICIKANFNLSYVCFQSAGFDVFRLKIQKGFLNLGDRKLINSKLAEVNENQVQL